MPPALVFFFNITLAMWGLFSFHTNFRIVCSSSVKNAGWPSNCTTKNISKGYENADLTGHMYPNVYSSTINNSHIMKRAQMSIDWWMDKEMWYIHTMEYYSVMKKNEILTFETMWIEPECIMLSEISQSEKGRYHMISLMCGIWKTQQMNIREGKEKCDKKREEGKP